MSHQLQQAPILNPTQHTTQTHNITTNLTQIINLTQHINLTQPITQIPKPILTQIPNPIITLKIMILKKNTFPSYTMIVN